LKTALSKRKGKENETKLNTVVPVSFPNIALETLKNLNKKPYFKNATVWTNEKKEFLQKDVLVKNGKIAAIGNNLRMLQQQ
jgi:hypothetical protein